MNNDTRNLMFSQKSDEWETPEEFVRGLEKSLGIEFDLDPCATTESAKCPKFFTIEDDGLNADWGDARHVFINPPYSDIASWVERALQQIRAKEGKMTVTFLIPARMDTKIVQGSLTKAMKVYFVKSRIKFHNEVLKTEKEAEGKEYKINSAPFPSVVMHFDYGSVVLNSLSPKFGRMDNSGKILERF